MVVDLLEHLVHTRPRGISAGRVRATEEPLPGHALLAVAALTCAVVARGAYHGPAQWALALTLGAAVVVAARAHPLSRGEATSGPVLGCAALAAWATLSAALAGDASGAASTVALLAMVVAAFVVCRRTSSAQRELLAGALLAVGVLLALTGWAGLAWRVEPWAFRDPGGTWRAATTMTYANAAAGILAPLALLAVARLAAARRSLLDTGAAVLLLAGVGATQSRGGAIALVVGGVALVALLGARTAVRAAGPPLLGAAIALAGLAPSFATGAPARPGVAVAGLVAGLAVAAAAQRGRARWIRIGIAVGACVVLASAGLERAAPAVDSRLTLTSRGRAGELAAALRLAAQHPVTGVGPGRAVLTWRAPDGRLASIRYAHDEYAQVLAELGAVGLLALVGLLGAVARAAWRNRFGAPSREAFAGVLAALVALAVHSGFDFLWHVPAVALTGALLAGLALPIHPLTKREDER